MTRCQTSVKQTQIKAKIGTVTNINMENSTVAFISKIDNLLINYVVKLVSTVIVWSSQLTMSTKKIHYVLKFKGLHFALLDATKL